MGVHIAGRHGGEPLRLGELREVADEGQVAARAGALQLDEHVAAAERVDQFPGSGLGVAAAAGRDETGHGAVAGAAGEADEALGVGRQVGGVQFGRQGAARGGRARVAVGEGDEPAEVGVAGSALREERDVRTVGQGELGPGDGADAGVAAGVGEHERPGEPVVVRQRQRLVSERGGLLGHLLGARCAVQEAEGAVRVQFDVGGARHRTHVRRFRPAAQPMRSRAPHDARVISSGAL